MALYAGNSSVKALYYGSTPVKAVYYGSTLVFSPLPVGTVVAKDYTGDSTGTFTIEVPGSYKVYCVGGGGGASMKNASGGSNNPYATASGGGGGYGQAIFTFSAGDVLSWKVGARAGFSGLSANGPTGGQSYIKLNDATTLIAANGGNGGKVASKQGGTGGTVTIDSSGTIVVQQTGNSGAYKEVASNPWNYIPAAAAGLYSDEDGEYGRSTTGYATYNNPQPTYGTAGLIKVEFSG